MSDVGLISIHDNLSFFCTETVILMGPGWVVGVCGELGCSFPEGELEPILEGELEPIIISLQGVMNCVF